MIAPPPRCAITGMTAREARNVPVRLMPMTRFHASGSVSVAEPNDSTPAAVIRMSMPPNSAAARAAIASTCAGSDTSTAIAAARGGDLPGHRAGVAGVDVRHQDGRTLAGEPDRRRAADAGAAPGDHRHLLPESARPARHPPAPSAVAAVGPGALLQGEILDA